ncbi:hypothetical protein ACLB2K_024461 [Fragaria x ananassa]
MQPLVCTRKRHEKMLDSLWVKICKRKQKILRKLRRWYAFVKKVFTTEFKLRIRWLVADPDDHGEINWSKRQLPVACGKFRLGKTEEITDHLSFSHKIQYTKGSHTSSVLVYPRRGETWAIYQNWDIGWSSEPETYKYEFVEVLSDFVEGVGVAVTYLGKVKGFVSLFQQTEQQGFQVPPAELYRFSHHIPSFKMTGHEGCGVPSGSCCFARRCFGS